MGVRLTRLRSRFEGERERLAEELRRLGDGNLSAGGREEERFQQGH